MQKTQKNAQTRAYQLIAVIAAIFFVSSIIQTIIFGLTLRVSSGAMSWYVPYVLGQMLPIPVFALLWFLARGNRWERVYQASLFAIAGVLLSGALTTVLMTAVWPLLTQPVMELLSPVLLLNSMPFVLQLLVAVALALLLRRQKKTAPAVQMAVRVLMIALGVFFFVDISQTMYFVFVQYPDNQNLSGYMPSFVGYGIVAAAFIATYLFERMRGGASLRTSVIVTTMGLMLLYAGALPLGYLPPFASMAQWVKAALIALAIIVAIVIYGWVYRTLRVLK